MKHKTSELTGELLDAAAAKAEGSEDPHSVMTRADDGALRPFEPSSTWNDGGPIIEREGIATWRGVAGWHAIHPNWFKTGYDGRHEYIDVESGDCYSGPTPLIAAMRAYVASKFGKEVEL